MSEVKSDICSPDTSEDHQQQTSPIYFSKQSRNNGNNQSINSIVDQLIPRLVDYIRKQNDNNNINSIANHVFK